MGILFELEGLVDERDGEVVVEGRTDRWSWWY